MHACFLYTEVFYNYQSSGLTWTAFSNSLREMIYSNLIVSLEFERPFRTKKTFFTWNGNYYV